VRSASPWVWVLLLLATLEIAIGIRPDVLTFSAPYSFTDVLAAVLAPTALVIAAALMFVAPRERLIQLAAFGLAVPEAVKLVRLALPLIEDAIGQSSYWDLLPQRLYEWTNALSSVTWTLTLAALLALALYIGRVRSQRGWLIVLGSAVLAVALAVVHISNWLSLVDQIGDGLILAGSDKPSLLDLALGIASQLVIVGWGYLLAAAYEQRKRLLAVGTTAAVMTHIPYLLTASVLLDWWQQDQSGANLTVLSLLGDVITLVYAVVFIGGVLTELPRHGPIPAADGRVSRAEAFSAGR
jgi:hypothetical protein